MSAAGPIDELQAALTHRTRSLLDTIAQLASERPVGGATRAGGKQRVVPPLKKTR